MHYEQSYLLMKSLIVKIKIQTLFNRFKISNEL